MKAYSLLPDTHIIANPRGGVMDKMRIFCEGIVNKIRGFPMTRQNRRGVGPGGFAFCLREKREREDFLMKSRFTSS